MRRAVSLGRPRLSKPKLDQPKLVQIKLDQPKLGQIKLDQLKLGQRIHNVNLQVRSNQIRSIEVKPS